MSRHVASIPIAEVAAHLPAFPRVVPELLDCLEEDGISLDSLVRIARNDPAISAAILAAANRLRRMRALSDLQDLFAASSVIGLSKIRRIILSVGLNRFLGQECGQSRFFEHSRAVAILAQELAASARISSDEAYVAGILHDVGQLAFYVLDRDRYREMRREAIVSGDLLRLETEVFGLDHSQVGALLAGHWHLPKSIVSAIATHHDCDTKWQGGLPALIYLAETLARGVDLPHSPSGRVTVFNEAAIKSLQLSWDGSEMADCINRSRARFLQGGGI